MFSLLEEDAAMMRCEKGGGEGGENARGGKAVSTRKEEDNKRGKMMCNSLNAAAAQYSSTRA
jgi:hypothetical protein